VEDTENEIEEENDEKIILNVVDNA